VSTSSSPAADASRTQAIVPPHAIVVGVDGSPSSEEALRWALRQSSLTGQEVHAVNSWGYAVDYGVAMGDFDWQQDAESVLEKSVQQVTGGDAERVHQHVIAGHPVRALLDAAKDADLLVVGCRGHGGFTGMLLGSVSQHVAAHATCPVLVVHDPADAGVVGAGQGRP
jgi:nucleotide-binding universal stress UspA family protein